MFHQLHIPLSYLQYWLKAVDKHSLHPPFVYQLFCSVINSKKEYYCFKPIENLRKEILNDQSIIKIQDLGAGSRINNRKERKVKDIAKTGLSSPKFSQLLFKLIGHFKPSNIIELGTSLGINTLYMSSYSSNARVFTFEGCPETAGYAEMMFNKMNKNNIEILKGDINVNLPLLIDTVDKVDFIYFDANHSYEPTLFYFETSLKKAHENSIFIFDDIHWSPEMERAWEEIKKHPKVTLTIDIFDAGMAFFNKRFNKENYILEF